MRHRIPLLASLTVLAGPMACLAQSTAPAQSAHAEGSGSQLITVRMQPSGATRPGQVSA